MEENTNTTTCSICGSQISKIDKYCPNCGTQQSQKSTGIIPALTIVGLLILANVVAGGFMLYKVYKLEQPNKIHTSRHQRANTVSKTSTDFSEYMRDMQLNIKQNWTPPVLKEHTNVTVQYKIGKNGELLSYSIYKSSGNKEMDNSAIEALKQTAPFRPLPNTYKKSSIDVQFTFDYNVINK